MSVTYSKPTSNNLQASPRVLADYNAKGRYAHTPLDHPIYDPIRIQICRGEIMNNVKKEEFARDISQALVIEKSVH